MLSRAFESHYIDNITTWESYTFKPKHYILLQFELEPDADHRGMQINVHLMKRSDWFQNSLSLLVTVFEYGQKKKKEKKSICYNEAASSGCSFWYKSMTFTPEDRKLILHLIES